MKIFDKIDTNTYPTFEVFKEEYWRTNKLIKFPTMFGVIALVFPLCLLKDVSKMRYASLFGVLALIYSIVVIVVESVFFLIYKNKDIISKMNWFNISSAFSYKEGYPFFGGLATVFYIYSCHAGAFPVYKTLRKHTARRIRKVYRRSILLDIIIYFSVAAASFITAPENPPELILYRENLEEFNPDYFVIVAKVGIILNLFFSTPANYAGLRISLFELIWGNSKITNCKNIFVTLITLSIVTLIGALYDKILDYIELLGGFCSVIYCFLIPGLIYVKSDPNPASFRHIFIIFMVSSLTVIGYTSGIMTILFNMVKING
jgi:amino acid permease